MATDPLLSDPLLSLRRAIAAQALPTPTTSSDVSNAADNLTDDLAKASHLYFAHPLPHTLPLNTLTRFVSTANNDAQVDLRSIFFAWQKKDVAIPEYIASAQEVNEALKQKKEQEGGNEEQVLNLVFVERLDLITWLEGASDDSEYIKPLEGAAAAAEAAAASAAADVTAPIVAADAATAAVPKAAVSRTAAPGAKPTKVIDPQLQEIYNGERKLGDRNTVLRGIKPTVCVALRASYFCYLSTNGYCRTSRIFAKLQRSSLVATAARAANIRLEATKALQAKEALLSRLPQPVLRFPRNQALPHQEAHDVPTPSSSSLHPPHLLSVSPISSHSFKMVSLYPPTIPH